MDHRCSASDPIHNQLACVLTVDRLLKRFPPSVFEGSAQGLENHDYIASSDLSMATSTRCSMECPDASTRLILSMASSVADTTATSSTSAVSLAGDSTSTASSDAAYKLFDRMPRRSEWSSDCSLSIMVCRALFPVNEDMLRPLLAPYGVKWLVVNPRATTAMGSQYVTAIVELNSRDAAARAHVALQGKCLFDGCCCLCIRVALSCELPSTATSSEAAATTAQAVSVMNLGVSQIEMPVVYSCLLPTHVVAQSDSMCSDTVIVPVPRVLDGIPMTDSTDANDDTSQSDQGLLSTEVVQFTGSNGVNPTLKQAAVSDSACVDLVSLAAEEVLLDTKGIFPDVPILSEVSTFQPRELLADNRLCAFVQWSVPSRACAERPLNHVQNVFHLAQQNGGKDLLVDFVLQSPLPPSLQSVKGSQRDWNKIWLEVREDRGSFERIKVVKLQPAWPPPLGMCMTLSMGKPPRPPCLHGILIFMCIASVFSYLNMWNSIEEPKPPWSLLVPISSNLVVTVSGAMHLTDNSLEFIQFGVATSHGIKSYSCLDSASKDDQFSNVTWVMQPRALLAVKNMVTLPVVDFLDSIVAEVTFKVRSSVSPQKLSHIVAEDTWDPWTHLSPISSTRVHAKQLLGVDTYSPKRQINTNLQNSCCNGWRSLLLLIVWLLVAFIRWFWGLLLAVQRSLRSGDYLAKRSKIWPPFSGRAVQGSVLFNCTVYCQGKSSWDPGIGAFLKPHHGHGKQVQAEEGRNIKTAYHGIDQVQIDCDYYFDNVRADDNYYYDTSLNCINFSNDLSDLVQVNVVQWDPGGFAGCRLGDKPKLKEGGLSATFLWSPHGPGYGLTSLGRGLPEDTDSNYYIYQAKGSQTWWLGTEGLRPRSCL